MKQLLLLAALFVTPFITSAQIEVEVEPDPLDYVFEVGINELADMPYLELVAHATLTNVSDSDTLTFVWVRKVIDAPEEWQYRTCDNTACYPTFVDTNYDPPAIPLSDLVVLAPGESSLIDLHVIPNHTAGCGEIDICIFDVDDLNNPIVVLHFGVCITTVNAVTEQELSSLDVYPNPTTDFFVLEGADVVDQVIVYDLLGRQLKSFNGNNRNSYDVSDLLDGVYLVNLQNTEAGTLKTVRILKKRL